MSSFSQRPSSLVTPSKTRMFLKRSSQASLKVLPSPNRMSSPQCQCSPLYFVRLQISMRYGEQFGNVPDLHMSSLLGSSSQSIFKFALHSLQYFSTSRWLRHLKNLRLRRSHRVLADIELEMRKDLRPSVARLGLAFGPQVQRCTMNEWCTWRESNPQPPRQKLGALSN